MIVGKLSRLEVDDEVLLPIAATARDAVSCILAVMREVNTLEGYGAIGAQLVGVEEHAGLAIEGILHVEHALVLKAIVTIEVPLAIMLARGTNLLIVSQLG